MPFSGTPVIKQIADNMVRVTGLTVPAASAGQLALHGFVQPIPEGPDLGAATRFGILTTSYVNAVDASIIGDLGYVNPPAVAANVSGTTHVNDATYTAAQTAAAAARVQLLAATATFTFAPGAIDLGTDVTHGAAGVYTPGVYVVTGAADINGATITLSGSGTYVFRISGAFTTAVDSIVQCTNGADPAHVWWVVGANSTIGDANVFVGTLTPSAAATLSLGDSTVVTGRALSFTTTTTVNATTVIVPRTVGNAVILPAAFAPKPEAYLGSLVTLQDAIDATVQAVGQIAVQTVVAKAGTTPQDFTITVYNQQTLDGAPLEILIRFHD